VAVVVFGDVGGGGGVFEGAAPGVRITSAFA
jgi:hypothetical protein